MRRALGFCELEFGLCGSAVQVLGVAVALRAQPRQFPAHWLVHKKYSKARPAEISGQTWAICL